jgi:RNA polymerase sigma-70 factor (ECF subfamily)
LSLKNTDIITLLALCQKGNHLAQLEVYHRYYLAMYNTALRIVKQTDEAEDVMQEAFLAAFTKLHTFQGDASFGSWLKKIVVNHSISKIKKQHPFESLEDYKINVQEDDDETASETYSQLKAHAVLQSIQQLKPNYATALTLFFIEGYDYDEVSSILNISYANCRTLISRAKEQLRKQLTVTI